MNEKLPPVTYNQTSAEILSFSLWNASTCLCTNVDKMYSTDLSLPGKHYSGQLSAQDAKCTTLNCANNKRGNSRFTGPNLMNVREAKACQLLHWIFFFSLTVTPPLEFLRDTHAGTDRPPLHHR